MMHNTHYNTWLNAAALSDDERAELLSLQHNEAEIKERFHAPLSFGTAGIRGIMGVGLHRMNIHVIRHASQAFADVILREGTKREVIIAYDCRNNAQLFAEETAAVMAANGIFVRLFPSLRPTPELSFAIRHFGAQAGINLTASHNPKEYSGYKVYWDDGAQLPTAFANQIADRMGEIDLFADVKTMDYQSAVTEGKIEILGEDIDELFLTQVLAESVLGKPKHQMKIVYTPFHGAGAAFVPEVLKRAGFDHVIPVPEQMIPDGNFPTVESPNPEDPEGFAMAIALAKKENAQLIIGTDPDADRVGAMALHNGEYLMISGNQMGVLLLNYIIQAKKETGTMPKNPVFIQSIVSTKMSISLAEKHGVTAYEVFTGFKHLAEKIAELAPDQTPIFSFEEAFGYMIGDFVRDKDAVTTSLFVAQMADWYESRGMTLIDGIEALYDELGAFYDELTLNLVMPGLEGLKNMKALMEDLRSNPPQEIGGQKVHILRDYLDGREVIDGETQKMELSGSNVLSFVLDDGTTLLVRPSGTEPKVKVYILARGENREATQKTIQACTVFAESLVE